MCSFAPQAGLFSAVTSAFILDVQSQLQPDTGEETAALLRILIYKIDNTTFGNDTPTLPQWTGPPNTIVQVQAILCASLAASLLSAFLAMLGKQWLNRYASTDMRGTAVERSQNRQRKLDGIIAWSFDHVMESLPLMLQVALLLLGCALSHYLWEVNVTVASVVLGLTLSGVILYIFIAVAGATYESCPYQSPGSHALRYLRSKARNALHSTTSTIASAFRRASWKSKTVKTVKRNVAFYRPWWSRGNIAPFLKDMALEIPRALAIDVYHLGRATTWPLVAFPAGAYHLCSTIVRSLVVFVRRACNWSHNTPATTKQGSDQRAIVLDLRCISWILQTSLDKALHLSTLKHLAMMAALADFNPILVADCFSIFIGCINVSSRKVTIMQGLEQLATVSATCLLRTFHHLSITDPTSYILVDVRRRYRRVFPFKVDFVGLPFHHTVARIHALVNRRWNPRHVQWDDYRPSAQEHIALARDMVEAAQVEYQKTDHQEVPRWILRFTLRSLSLDPPPPTPVIADCLSTIAISLGCDVSDTRSTTSCEKCVHILQMTITLTLNQCTSGTSFEPDNAESQNDGRS